jgi:hypothetical protein
MAKLRQEEGKFAQKDQPGARPNDLIFSGCLNNPTRDEFPARGHTG